MHLKINSIPEIRGFDQNWVPKNVTDRPLPAFEAVKLVSIHCSKSAYKKLRIFRIKISIKNQF